MSDIEALATNRAEVRFVGTAEPLADLPPSVSELTYLDNVTTSVYFGVPGSQNPVPERGLARLRFRSAAIIPTEAELYVPDLEQPATLELKLHSQHMQGVDHTRKYSIGGLALGTAADILRFPDRFEQLDQQKKGSHFSKFLELIYGEKGLAPLVMIQACRRHFLIEAPTPARVTLDTGTSYWLLGDEGVEEGLYAARALTLPHNIVEIKRRAGVADAEEVGRAILSSIFGADSDYTSAARLKRAQGLSLIRGYGMPTFNNPEVDRSAEHPEVMTSFIEREMKLDVSADPRARIADVPRGYRQGIYLGSVVASEVFFRFTRVGGQVFGEKSKNSSFDPGSANDQACFQVKAGTRLSGGGVLVRDEKTVFSRFELMRLMGVAEDSTHSESRSPTALRSRISRYAICSDTGNFFVILADYCTAEDTREPLRQVEIEYQGRLGFPKETDALDTEGITKDFARIRALIGYILEGSDITILPTQTTKEQWLTD